MCEELQHCADSRTCQNAQSIRMMRHCADPQTSPTFLMLPGHKELHASLCRSTAHRPARMLTAAPGHDIQSGLWTRPFYMLATPSSMTRCPAKHSSGTTSASRISPWLSADGPW